MFEVLLLIWCEQSAGALHLSNPVKKWRAKPSAAWSATDWLVRWRLRRFSRINEQIKGLDGKTFIVWLQVNRWWQFSGLDCLGSVLLLMAAQVVSGPMNKQTVSSVGASCQSAPQTVRWPLHKIEWHTHTYTRQTMNVHYTSGFYSRQAGDQSFFLLPKEVNLSYWGPKSGILVVEARRNLWVYPPADETCCLLDTTANVVGWNATWDWPGCTQPTSVVPLYSLCVGRLHPSTMPSLLPLLTITYLWAICWIPSGDLGFGLSGDVIDKYCQLFIFSIIVCSYIYV